ncbi:MAG: nucleotidyltransferase family protein [Dehalococcoidia bacterium]
MTIAAILLAGGESSRMGTPKPLLEWGGRTLIEYQLAQLMAPPVDRVVVVLGHRADEVRPLVHRAGARAVINELYREGRASSLRVGADTLGEDTEVVLLLNVDQPRPHSVIERLVAEHRRRGNLISVPAFQGKRGHPPLLSGSLLGELREVREASQGLRGLMKAHDSEVKEVAFDTEIVLLDVNRPDEYERARASYFE